jgi:hypothetical protein
MEIVEALAELDGVDPLALDYSLYDYVDLEAIERMHANSATDWSLRFDVPGHEVTVRSDRTVLVDGRTVESPRLQQTI